MRFFIDRLIAWAAGIAFLVAIMIPGCMLLAWSSFWVVNYCLRWLAWPELTFGPTELVVGGLWMFLVLVWDRFARDRNGRQLK